MKMMKKTDCDSSSRLPGLHRGRMRRPDRRGFRRRQCAGCHGRNHRTRQ